MFQSFKNRLIQAREKAGIARVARTARSALWAPVLCLTGCVATVDDSEDVASEQQATCQNGDVTFTVFPLSGTNGRNWMIVNYLDLDPTTSLPGDPTTGLRDYQGQVGALARTYDGHQGVDISIPSFREMDNDMALVRAAAPGTVTEIIQTNPDRNTSCTGSPNIITVTHANGYKMRYWHIKRNSSRVSMNQSVSAGTVLAVAGSSGCSTQPHLHFEVLNCANVAIETFATNMWSAPPAYNPASNVMDVMLRAGGSPTVAQVKDPKPNPTQMAPGSTLGVGLSLAARGGDNYDVRLINPSGGIAAQQTNTIGGAARFTQVYSPSVAPITFTLGSQLGDWKVEVRVNGTLRVTRLISVTSHIERHGIAHAAFQSTFDDAVAAGYRPVWIDGYEVGSSSFVNALFGTVDSAWQGRFARTSAQHQSDITTLTGQGYALKQVDSYLVAGQVRYAAVFDKKPVPQWTAYHGATEGDHVATFNSLLGQGFRPVNISAVNVSGSRFFTALYDKANVGSFATLTGMTDAQYQTETTANVAAGRRVAYVNVFTESNAPRFSAIWNQANTGSWSAQHGMTDAAFGASHASNVAAGRKARCLTGYDSSGSARFAALWTSL